MPCLRVQLIPGRLSWAPERLSEGERKQHQVSAFDYCSVLGSKYQVEHYTEQSHGRAFGPLGILQTLEFAKNLRQHLLQLDGAHALELGSPPCDADAHSNAAVLVGSFLIISEGWSTQRVKNAMGQSEAARKFACSWSRVNRPETPWHMQVADCWLGIELAQKRGWLPPGVLDDEPHSSWATTYTRMLMVYDSAWLVPGRLMVSADPTTTAFDPNPETCSEVFPSKDSSTMYSEEETKPPRSEEASLNSVSTSFKLPGYTVDVDALSDEDGDFYGDVDWELVSTDTVCKDYSSRRPSISSMVIEAPAEGESVFNRNCVDGVGFSSSGKPKAFASYLEQDCKVSLILRTNCGSEPGMIEPYDEKAMLDHGIVVEDVFVDDHEGGLPPIYIIKEALDAATNYMHKESDAVLVHCKGGFGRSVTVACCILIDRFNVSGRALLGWVRLVRPGAVTTPKQEQFLCNIKGREDLHRVISGHRSCIGCSVM